MGQPDTSRFIVTFGAGTGPAIASASGEADAEAIIDEAAAEVDADAIVTRRLATGAALVETSRPLTPSEASRFMDTVTRNTSVAFVEPDLLMQPTLVPDDPQWGQQWHYFEPTGGIGLPAALDTADGSGVVVAVLDTGRTLHPDLDANMLDGYDFISFTSVSNDGDGRDADESDEGDWVAAGQCDVGSPAQNSSWHGTHVAGTIAAVTGNGVGVAGVAPAARVLPVRVLGMCGGFNSDVADAIVWASGGAVAGVPANSNPADVVNMSLGGDGACGATYQTAIEIAVANGTTVVAAAGNSNDDASLFQPASCANVIAVAATNRSGGRADYSNFGSVVDLAAPGGDSFPTMVNGVLSTLNSGVTIPGSPTYVFYQGTSMAAPHVSGVAALVLGQDTLTPAALEAHLENTARAFPATCVQCGSGIVDAAAAVGVAPPPPDPRVICAGSPSPGAIVGTNGNDTIQGTNGNDTIFALNGAFDQVFGNGGDDLICGGGGTDSVRGGKGNDVIIGADGTDVLFGDSGSDTLYGDGGGDFLDGGSGTDKGDGGPGFDSLTSIEQPAP